MRFLQIIFVLLLLVSAGCGGVEKTVLKDQVFPEVREKSPPKITVGEPKGEVVAAGLLQVHDRFITIEDILRPCGKKIKALGGKLSEAEFRVKAKLIVEDEIRRAVSVTMVLVEAERRMTEMQKAQIDAEVALAEKEMITSVGGSRNKLKQELAAEGMTLEEVLKEHRRAVTLRVYLHGKFMPRVVINRKMLWNYYRKHLGEYSYRRKVHLRIIAAPFYAFLPADSRLSPARQLKIAGKKARKLIDAAAVAVKSGEDFSAVAKRTAKTIRDIHGEKWDRISFPGKIFVTLMDSKGGLWNETSPESFRDQALAAAGGALKQGKVSDVIAGKNSCYLVKADKIAKARVVSFEDAQQEIARTLRRQEYNRLTDEHFAHLIKEYQRLQGPDGEALYQRFLDMVLNCVKRGA